MRQVPQVAIRNLNLQHFGPDHPHYQHCLYQPCQAFYMEQENFGLEYTAAQADAAISKYHNGCDLVGSGA